MEHEGADAPPTPTWLPGDLPPVLTEPPVHAPDSGYRTPPGHVPQPTPPGAYGPPPSFGPPSFGPAPSYGTAPSYGPGPSYGPAPSYGAASPFGPPPSYGPPPAPPSLGLAITGFVLAIVVAPVGLIVSIVALRQARRTGAGVGLPIAGIVVGAITSAMIVAAIAIPIAIEARLAADDGPRGAFHDMQSALRTQDCPAFLAATTDAFRSTAGVRTCEDFDLFMAAVAAEGLEFGRVPILGSEIDGDTATLTTAERYPSPDGGTVIERFEYTLVLVDGRWLVDAVVPAD